MAENSTHKKQEKKIEEYQKQLEMCEKECQEYLDGWKRAKADAENEKKAQYKRLEQERVNIKDEFLTTILPVLDSVCAAMSHSSDDKTNEGLKQIYAQFEQSFAQFGAKILDPINEEFNPNEHDAVGEKEVEDKSDSRKVLEVVRLGISIDGIIKRPAMVYIGKYTK